ncbi:hypothetical protein BJX99DRAFT_206690 [Aspergillus californicus]
MGRPLRGPMHTRSSKTATRPIPRCRCTTYAMSSVLLSRVCMTADSHSVRRSEARLPLPSTQSLWIHVGDGGSGGALAKSKILRAFHWPRKRKLTSEVPDHQELGCPLCSVLNPSRCTGDRFGLYSGVVYKDTRYFE